MRTALVLLACALGAGQAGAPSAPYGAKVEFRPGRVETFAHFRLEYLGERHAETPQFPRGIAYSDFVATTDTERVAVAWSAGTGDIGPAHFKIAGEHFMLELRRSDALGPLASNHLVVTHLGPLVLEPPKGAARLCGGHVTGAGSSPGTSGPHISWQAFTSPDPPASLAAGFGELLGPAEHAEGQACWVWRVPRTQPRRVLEICPPEPVQVTRDCPSVPEGTRSLVLISTMAR